MGGESSASSCEGSSGSTASGNETELLRIQGAQLFLVDGEQSALMHSGDFVFQLVKQANSPLAAVVAAVGDVQWPVGKDAPVIRVGTKRYSFALPGLLYGLVLPPPTSAKDIEKLETLLLQYSTFEIHPEIVEWLKPKDHGLLSCSEEQAAAEYWTTLAAQVEKTVAKIESQIRSGASGISASLGLRRGASTPVTGVKSPLEVSPRMMKRIQQARRMSAVAKLFSKTLMRGAISPVGHVANGLVGVEALSSDLNPLGKAIPRSEMRLDVAMASVDAFAKVLEAVESAGRSLLETACGVGRDVMQQRPVDQSGSPTQEGLEGTGYTLRSSWTLNTMGLRILFRAAAASMAINLARVSTSSSDHSSRSAVVSASRSKSSISVGSRSFSPPVQQQHQVSDSPPATHFPSYAPLPKPPTRSVPTSDDRLPPPGTAVSPQSLPFSTTSYSPFLLHNLDLAANTCLPSSAPYRRTGSLFQQYRRPPPQSQQRQGDSVRHLDQQPENSQ